MSKNNYHGATDDAVIALERDEGVTDVDGSLAVGVGLDVAKIADVALALGVSRSAVVAAIGVEVGTGGGAAVGVVAELVNVETVKARGKSGQLASHSHGPVTLKPRRPI